MGLVFLGLLITSPFPYPGHTGEEAAALEWGGLGWWAFDALCFGAVTLAALTQDRRASTKLAILLGVLIFFAMTASPFIIGVLSCAGRTTDDLVGRSPVDRWLLFSLAGLRCDDMTIVSLLGGLAEIAPLMVLAEAVGLRKRRPPT